MSMTWMEFLAGCLATFRLALLISKEDGPADAARKLRDSVPAGWIRRGFQCEWCQSFWWGLAVAIFFGCTLRMAWTDLGLYWLAFSGAGIILNQMFTRS